MQTQQRLKIALVIKECSCTRGGAERYSRNLACDLAELGHDVHLLAHRWDAFPAGITPHRIPIVKAGAGCKILSFSHYVRQKLLQEPFDIVYGLTQIYPLDLYRMGGGIHLHWLRLKYPRAVQRWLSRLTLKEMAACHLERRIFHPGNHRLIVANSRLTARHAQQYYRVPEERVRVIYNGVDQRLFHPGVRERYRREMRAKHGVQDEMLILFVSNNWSRKGLDVVIRAAQPLLQSGQAALMVVGKGKPEKYDRLLRKLGVSPQVRFIAPNDQVEAYYGMADVFVLPTRYDPFANTCLEAMACGLPVITTTANGAAELIREGRNGFLLDDPQDEHTLARRLQQLLTRSLRADMGAQAAGEAVQWTPRLNTLKTLEAFAEVLTVSAPA